MHQSLTRKWMANSWLHTERNFCIWKKLLIYVCYLTVTQYKKYTKEFWQHGQTGQGEQHSLYSNSQALLQMNLDTLCYPLINICQNVSSICRSTEYVPVATVAHSMLPFCQLNQESNKCLCAGRRKLIIGPQHRNSRRSCGRGRSAFCISGVTAILQKVLNSL